MKERPDALWRTRALVRHLTPKYKPWCGRARSNVTSPCTQGQISQRGEEILHLLLQKPVAVLCVLARPLGVSQFDLKHALLLPLLLHLLFQTLHLRTQSSAGLLESEGRQHNTDTSQRSVTSPLHVGHTVKVRTERASDQFTQITKTKETILVLHWCLMFALVLRCVNRNYFVNCTLSRHIKCVCRTNVDTAWD